MPVNDQWLQDELFAVTLNGLDKKYLDAYDANKYIENSFNSSILHVIGIADPPTDYPTGLTIFKGRNDLGDIDIDIMDTRRNEVKEYLTRKFKHVANISTFTYFKDKGVVRDSARILGVPLSDVNKVLKTIDTYDDFINGTDSAWFRNQYPDVQKIANYLRGRIRSVGMHAAGVIVSKEPINKYVPIETRTDTSNALSGRVPVVAYDMGTAEDIGLIKIDLLGLKTLSVIDTALKAIKQRHNLDIDLLTIDMEDSKVFGDLSNGFTKGVFQCMLPEQPIHTSSGVRAAKDISIGDIVLTHNGRFMPVTNIMKRDANEYMYEIIPAKQNGKSLSVTGEHPILISDNQFNLTWKKAQDIVGGRKTLNRKTDNWNEYFVVPKTSKNIPIKFGDININEEVARFLGLYVAEGCISSDGRLTFTFHKKEQEYIDFVVEILTKYFNVNPKVHIRENTASIRVGMRHNIELFRSWCGHGAKNKFINPDLFVAPVNIIRAFLTGYAEGDGKIEQTGHVTIQTASKNLAWGLKALVVNIGSYTKVGHHIRKLDGYGTYNVYTCSFHLGGRKTHRVLQNKDYILIPIKCVRKYNYEGTVVNFEVEGDNSYVSDYTLHNCEAAPYTKLLERMGIDHFDQLVASNALVRPGAMNTIGVDYIARKQGRASVLRLNPIYDEITKDTYGCVLYQEQVMLLCNKLAGMSWSDADKIRKIIGKKKDVHEFDQYKKQFVDGASRHITSEMAEKLWHDFEAHSNYSFNRSHAVAYSTVSYWTAWLKHYYPLEFMYAILINEQDKESKTDYLIEAKRIGIKVYLPHVNSSVTDFSIDGEAIRFGLSDIKYLSDKIAPRIINLGPFASYADLCEKTLQPGTGINSRAIDSLNKVGAAEFHDNPLRGDEKDYYYEYLNIPQFSTTSEYDFIDKLPTIDAFDEKETFIFFAMVKSIKRGKGWSRVEIVDRTGSIGVFHTEHTQIMAGKMYLLLVGNNRIYRYVDIEEVKELDNDPFIRYLKSNELKIQHDKKVVIAFSTRKTKANKHMATVVLSNKDKELITVTVWPKDYARALGRLQPGMVVDVALRRSDDNTLFVKSIN